MVKKYRIAFLDANAHLQKKYIYTLAKKKKKVYAKLTYCEEWE